jgi:beta-glucosidase
VSSDLRPERPAVATHRPRRRRRIITVVLAWLALVGAAEVARYARGTQATGSPDEPLDVRVRQLVGRMTIDEKVSQLVHEAPAIERLGVPKYTWWNEALHGVARAGLATVFPQAIGLAATWDVPLMERVATAISDEARAKHHEAVRHGEFGLYQGLTFWSPNINIFRDPRWGRGMETYGEDPFLAGRLAVAFVRGMQGDDPQYLKTVATPKHYAVHSGPETDRHSFDAEIDERDLRETYLPQFEMAVREGGAFSVMCAYNRFLGDPCCASPKLLDSILRREWGFEGYVVSDCDSIADIYRTHKIVKTGAEAAAMALKAGCDLNCGTTYKQLTTAFKQGLVTEAQIDTALTRLFTVRFRLGMFDPPERVRYANIPYTVVDSEPNRALALEATRRSIVLLKNDNDVLPLRKDVPTVAVIGPNADDVEVLLGNYNGTPSKPVTPLQGIRDKLGASRVVYAQGSDWAENMPALDKNRQRPAANMEADAIAAATKADAVVLVLGLSPRLEGEEMRVPVPGFKGGDRLDIELPAAQQRLMEAVQRVGKPTVLVLLNGSALATRWADEHIPAIVEAWYPGQAAGTAIADVLFGDSNPGGRLPITFYRSIDQLPPFADYHMAGRTYRYFKGAPLYPFGHGLSYTRFAYEKLAIPKSVASGASVNVSVDVRNVGQRTGDEVVQLYVSDLQASVPVPLRTLAAFERVTLKPGEVRHLTFTLTPRQLSLLDHAMQRVVEPGTFEVAVGGKQPGFTGHADAKTTGVVTGRFEGTGSRIAVK